MPTNRVSAPSSPGRLTRPAVTALRSARDAVELRRTPHASIDTGSLIRSDDVDLQALLEPGLSPDWSSVDRAFTGLGIPEGTGGVNPGDRRALYSIAQASGARRILEIGTHIGASTIAFASALGARPDPARTGLRLVTVDIVDVNATAGFAPWQAAESPAAPRDLLIKLGLENVVTFATRPSLAYLDDEIEPFDVIFLDGSHRAHVLYQEIPAALRALRKGGLVILHDYFPGGRPIWTETSAIPGPYLAVRRLQREGADLHVHPLGLLPWKTKFAGRSSSLALLSRS